MPSCRLYVFRKTKDCNENVCPITIQLFPFVWMLHSRTFNNKINRLLDRALTSFYSDYKSLFNTLLEKNGSFSIRHRNIQSIAI